ncbi:type II toxin-antitoxin system VapC family toxin [Acidiferrimicrobium sp. IK]|uniref:type II toxin-antitoxin system VapC family toxin n=1 Tax=Acidiferrimicrobium sp. IK TaxID=2871700 RepID=UPI0021CB0229|nr:type II toxin-antitoxin system VapC family toxin [Acidiferrimicrobium sp. IK]MCU4185580.1 type II toxin-antitoxin system VapC family toxin [Acidiferrimicrobium sp. IK]
MIVVDAAAVVDVLTVAASTGALRSRLAGEELHAPSLLDFELVSALRGLTLRSRLSSARALDALADFEDLPLYRWPASEALRRRAFDLRHAVSAYDASYVALAEALECPLVTRDARLARSRGHDARIEVH